ncbi:MAG: DUF4199 domain-containing protein [Gammaproteobacteria bacterium]|nr:DUF4199 domain-containing protein [Gammaproteobacteria bacterium]
MFRSVLLLGLIAGLIVAALTLLVTTVGNPTQPALFLLVIKYVTIAVVVFLFFFGIKSLSVRMRRGIIYVPPGIVVGFGIVALASLIYSMSWEVYYYSTDYQFAREVSQNLVQRAQLEGATAVEIATLMERNAKIVEAFANPFLRIAMAFLQMFVIGAVVSIVGAMLIRNPQFLANQRNHKNES